MVSNAPRGSTPPPAGHGGERRGGWTRFVVIQAALIAAAAVWVGLRAADLRNDRRLPVLRNVPLHVPPLYDRPRVVTDEQLARVLKKLVPRFYGSETKINHVDHALRFWTTRAEFDDPKLLDGETMRQLLTDHRVFAKLYGEQQEPLLIDRDSGIAVRVQEGPTTSSHVDHTVATLAEVGTPLDFPVRTATHEMTYGDMVRHVMESFSLNQGEYEWSAMTMALFLPPQRSWITREGQRIDFDQLARRIMRQEMPQGVCFGNHRLFALVMMLRIHQAGQPILSDIGEQEITDYLAGMTKRLVDHQHPDGFWNANWPQSKPPGPASEVEGNRIMDQILATGHALEWWSMSPESLHPPRHVIVTAGQWMVRTIDDLSEDEVRQYYTFLSHAGRALALWRSRDPADVVRGPLSPGPQSPEP